MIPSDTFWADVLRFCHTTTAEVGEFLMEKFGRVEAVRKQDGTLVTEADQWSDRHLREAIAHQFPDHGVLSEETTHVFPGEDWCWIIDPIDGTTNFTRGLPIWGISLALLYKGTPVFGFVHFPPIRQTFHGYWYGDSGLTGPTGAFLNGQAIATTEDRPSRNHLFNLCARSTEIAAQPFPCKLRLVGVATYNSLLVALGGAIGGVEATPKIWDIAAVWAIVQAAGGVFVSLTGDPVFPLHIGTDYGDRPWPSLVLSRAELLEEFWPLVAVVGDQVRRGTLP